MSNEVPYSIREAELDDCEDIAAIYDQSLVARDSSMDVSTSAVQFEEHLEQQSDRECCLVLWNGERVRGFALLKSYSERVGYRVACETSIYLDRSLTGAGLGTRLQLALLEKCREYEYHHVVAKIWASNRASVSFHLKFGYEIVGVQKEIGYLEGGWKDVVILQLLLGEVGPYRPDLA